MLTKKLFFLLLICFAIASCNKEEVLPADNTTIDDSILTDANLRSPTIKSTADINYNPTGPTGSLILFCEDCATLRRNTNGTTANFKTDGLIPGNAYTLWWAVFGEVPGPPTLIPAAGHIVGASGKGNFSSHLSITEHNFDPLTATIELALRTHGVAQPGMIPSQIQTFSEGCLTDFPPGPAIYPDSDEVGYCANIQVARFEGN